MEKFEYGIEVNGTVIAKFLYEHDRDTAQEALADDFEDNGLFSSVYLGPS